jgi:hypothetical protein
LPLALACSQRHGGEAIRPIRARSRATCANPGRFAPIRAGTADNVAMAAKSSNPRKAALQAKLDYMRDVLQFDLTEWWNGRLWIRCSQCQAIGLQDRPLHEAGCIHDTRECAGCKARVPLSQEYCRDCRPAGR